MKNESGGIENIFGEDTSKEAILNITISTLINDYGKIKENLDSIAKERVEEVVESVEEVGPAETIEEQELDENSTSELFSVVQKEGSSKRFEAYRPVYDGD